MERRPHHEQRAFCATIGMIGALWLGVPVDPSARLGGSAEAADAVADRWSARAELHLLETETGAPDTLHLRFHLRNETERTLRVEHGACPVRLHAFDPIGSDGPPLWRSEHREPWEGDGPYACPLYLAMEEVAPGAEISPPEFTLKVPMTELLADTLHDGVYHFTGHLNAGSDEFVVDLGRRELALDRPPLPERRDARAFTFEARTQTSHSATVLRTEVTATLTHVSEAVLRFAADCPVVLLAYRSRNQRDAAPRAGDPARRTPSICDDQEREMRIARGEEVTFALEISTQDLLGTSLPQGRFYLAAAVQLEGRRVFLSAGEVDLRR